MSTGPISGAKNSPVSSSSEEGYTGSNLFYTETFLTLATQQTNITVLADNNILLNPDEVIVQYVSLADLNSVMSYTGTWNPNQGPTGESGYNLPDITVDFTPLLNVADGTGEMGEVFRKTFTGGDVGPSTDPSLPLMRDYSGDASVWPIQTYFTNMSFNYSGTTSLPNSIDESVLNSIPIESITNVNTLPLTCESLKRAVNGENDVFKEKIYIYSDSSQQNQFVRQLFEQAAAAGKIDTTTQVTNFLDGDSITIYVEYEMSKTKKFLIDGVGGDPFKPLGLDINISNGEILESGKKIVMVGWQFVGKIEKPDYPSQAPPSQI
jgi:hypothetical protein